MIRDLEELEDGVVLRTEICALGAGAAGIALAREFFGTQTEVLLVEAGGMQDEQRTQALYEAEDVGVPFEGAMDGRARVFGGTTTLWGGQTIPMFDHDFRPRAWIPGSGWPIGLEVLAPYYPRAEEVLDLDQAGYGPENWERLGIEPPAFDTTRVRHLFSRFNRVILEGEGKGIHDLRHRYEADFRASPNVTVLLHANITGIRATPGADHVDHVTVRTLDGKQARIEARHYILCCGGIETPRLLLLSNDVQPTGLGNGHDLVGRYFHEHPIFESGTIHTDNHRSLQERFVLLPRGNQIFWCRMELGDAIQERERLLKADANIFFDMNQESGIAAAMELWKGWLGRRKPEDFGRNLWRAFKGFPEMVRFGVPYFLFGRWPMPKPKQIRLQCRSEQLPDPESRVSLSTERDALGLPKARIDWRLSELERKTVLTMTRTVGEEFERLGMGKIEVSPWLLEDDWRLHVKEGRHHSGTTRMSDDPGKGVVDTECRLHGVDNLYIASSSVFPTSGTSNTTLTIMAFAIRIADRLKGA